MSKGILRKVLLEEAETQKDDMALTGAFVRAAAAQGFAVEWVDGVFTIALLNQTILFRRVLLDHIETTLIKKSKRSARRLGWLT